MELIARCGLMLSAGGWSVLKDGGQYISSDGLPVGSATANRAFLARDRNRCCDLCALVALGVSNGSSARAIRCSKTFFIARRQLAGSRL